MRALYFAYVKEQLDIDSEDFDLREPTTVKAFFDENIAHRLEGKTNNLLFAINEEMVEMEHPLTNKDLLAIMPPLSGGSN